MVANYAPAIPSLPPETPAELALFLNAVKASLDALTSATNAAVVTQADLNAAIEAAVSNAVAQSTAITTNIVATGGSTSGVNDTRTPTAPSGLTVTGGFSTVVLQWDTIPASPPVAFTTIYRAAVDDFSQAAPVGNTRVRLYADFVPDSQVYYYWITFTTEAGIEGAPNQTAGTQAAASLDPTYTTEVLTGAITDAQVASLGADKIVAATLAAFTANLGTVTAGALISPDETFKVDLSNKEIIISGPNGQVADDYTRIRNGAVEVYEWNGSTHILAKALRGLAAGIAENGAVVTLPANYFRQQPKVIVSPASLQVYDAAFTAQSQTIQCEAQNIVEVTPGSGVWQFNAVATLVIAAGTAINAPGVSVPDTQSDSVTSAVYTTPSTDVVRVSVNLRVQSFKGTGSSGLFFFRRVTIALQARPTSGGAWVTYASKVINFGATLGFVATTLSTGTLGANRYNVRIILTYSNAGGTFGSAQFIERQHTTSPARSGSGSTNTSSTDGSVSLPSFSPPAGSIIKSVEKSWTYSISYFLVSTGTGSNVSARVRVEGRTNGPQRTASFGNVVDVDFNGSSSDLETTSSYDAALNWSIVFTTSGGGFGNVSLNVSNAIAVITYDEPVAGDTITHNAMEWDTITTTLSASEQLAAGTLNWLVVGES